MNEGGILFIIYKFNNFERRRKNEDYSHGKAR